MLVRPGDGNKSSRSRGQTQLNRSRLTGRDTKPNNHLELGNKRGIRMDRGYGRGGSPNESPGQEKRS